MSNSFELQIMHKGKTGIGNTIIDSVYVKEGNVPYIGEEVRVYQQESTETLYIGRVADVQHYIRNRFNRGYANHVIVTVEIEEES